MSTSGRNAPGIAASVSPTTPDGNSSTATTNVTDPRWGTGPDSDTWTGAGEAVGTHYVSVSLDVDEPGTLFYEFSWDGGVDDPWSQFPPAGFPVTSGIHNIHKAIKLEGRHFRPRFEGDDGTRTFFRLYTQYTNVAGPLSSPLSFGVGPDDDASTVKSVQFGSTSGGSFEQVGVRRADSDQFASLTRDVGLDNNRTIFGALNTETPIPDVRIDFSEVALNLISDATTTTGVATQVNSQSSISTGVDAAGSATRRTRINVRYRPGSELRFDFTAVFSAAVASSSQYIGALSSDDQDGVFLGYSGTGFVVTQRQGGVDIPVPMASWNGDPLDGTSASTFTRDGVPEVWSPQAGNVYRIRLGWLGYSVIVFEVQSPDGEYVKLHTIKYPNTSTVPHLFQNDLQIWTMVENTGNTTDVSMQSASWRGSSMTHNSPQARTIFERDGVVDGALPSGGAVTIDPVLNTEPNVLDTGWVSTFDFPGGNFINVTADQTVDVYLMNATSAAGDNIVGSGAPAIQTVPFVPATFGAPYFHAFYRLVVVNTSGSSLVDWFVFNRGHETIQQPLSLGLEQTVLSFFTSALTRSVLLGKDPVDGFFRNATNKVLTDAFGVDRVAADVNVVDGNVDIEPLTTWDSRLITATATPQEVTASSPLVGRRTIVILNDSSGTREVHVGPTMAVSVANGKLEPGDSLELDIDDSSEVWVRTSAGSQPVSVFETGL